MSDDSETVCPSGGVMARRLSLTDQARREEAREAEGRGSLAAPEETRQVEAAGKSAPEVPWPQLSMWRRRSAACLRGVGLRFAGVQSVFTEQKLMRTRPVRPVQSARYQSGFNWETFWSTTVRRSWILLPVQSWTVSVMRGWCRLPSLLLRRLASAANFPIWLQPHLNSAPWRKGVK